MFTIQMEKWKKEKHKIQYTADFSHMCSGDIP